MFVDERMKRIALFCVLSLVLVVAWSGLVHAGTGGAEVQSWWTEITDGLKGFWGKVLAAVFIGFAIMNFVKGGVIPGIFMFLVALLIGTIPDMVNTRYTLTF